MPSFVLTLVKIIFDKYYHTHRTVLQYDTMGHQVVFINLISCFVDDKTVDTLTMQISTGTWSRFCQQFPRGGTQQSFIRGGSTPRSKPLFFYVPFLIEKVPL